MNMTFSWVILNFNLALKFDLHLSRSERIARTKNEGFGTNTFGTNTGVIYNAGSDLFFGQADSVEGVDENINEINNAKNKISSKPNSRKNTSIQDLKLEDQAKKRKLKDLNDWNDILPEGISPMEVDYENKKLNVRKFRIVNFNLTIAFNVKINRS